MTKISSRLFTTVTSIAVISILPLSARAQSAPETLYKSKCAACHGADGKASAAGKKLGAHDFQTAEVQKMSDTDFSTIITNGKDKMPAYGKSLKPEDVNGLVAYIHSLNKCPSPITMTAAMR